MMQKGLFNVYNFDGGAHEDTEKAYTLHAGLQEEREGSYRHIASMLNLKQWRQGIEMCFVL